MNMDSNRVKQNRNRNCLSRSFIQSISKRP